VKPRLVFSIPGPIRKGLQAVVHVYLGVKETAQQLAPAVWTKDAPKGMKWLENAKVRLLLGPEGAHVYRWEVKAMGNRDVTEPGETGWAGFADAGFDDRGPRTRWPARPAGRRWSATGAAPRPAKSRRSASMPAPRGWKWCSASPSATTGTLTTPKNFAAEFSTPGKYLFSSGATGPVGKHADGVSAQVKGAGVYWAMKFNQQKLAVGMASPETAASYCIAPGSGEGGVGIESSVPASHFVTFAGILEDEPKEMMTRLQQTLDLRNPAEVVIHAIQPRQPAER